MTKITSAMTDAVVTEELFNRLEQRRKDRNLTQKAFAEEYLGVTVKTYRSMREGRCALSLFLLTLRQLNLLDNLNQLIPEAEVRPSAVLKEHTRRIPYGNGKDRLVVHSEKAAASSAKSSVKALLEQRKKLKTSSAHKGEG
jgi:transcriptional regulator with XRE-family HTH domain